MVSRGVCNPDQLRFLYPSDFRSIKVIQAKYNPNSQDISLGDKKSKYLKSKRPTNKKRQKNKSRVKSLPTQKISKNEKPSPLHCGPEVDDNIWPAWTDYLKENQTSAQLALQQLLSDYPNHWTAYELLVDVMLQSGQDMDISNQLRVLEKRSDLPARMLALIGCGYEAAGDIEQAEHFSDQALSRDADCARAWNLKGVIAYRNGQYEKAAQHFQKASELDGSWGNPWTNMGTLHWDHGDHDKALDCFEIGFQLSPTAPNVVTTYHMAISHTEQYKRAKPVFEDVVSSHPDFRRARFLLIDILIRLEDCPTALDQIEAVLLRFGNDLQLLEAAKAVRSKVGPMTIPKGKCPSLSLCMIVRNEEKYFPRCLQSLKPLVDEMIVVDTGSTDSTRDIAEIFGATVFEFEWNDDFAAARNHSIDQASGDWILVMDADEVIASYDHQSLRDLIRKHHNNKVAFSIVTRNYTHKYNGFGWTANNGSNPEEESGCGWTPSEKVRLFRNESNIRFQFPVHELVDPALKRDGHRIKKCPVRVHHYGYLDIAYANSKGAHYYKIGKKKLKEMGGDPIALRELAAQADLLEKHDEAINFWKQLAVIQPKNPIVYINLSATFGKLGQYKESKAAAKKAIKLAPSVKEGYLNLGRIELFLGNFSEACIVFQKVIDFEPNYYSAIFMLGASQICSGDSFQGKATIAQLKPLRIWNSLPHAFKNIAGLLTSAGFGKEAQKLLDCLTDLNYGKKESSTAASSISDKAPNVLPLAS
jgi:tetratricopeptide (TPR) repeat protein